MNPHVAALVQLFVKKDKRERMLMLAVKASRRGDFRHDLLHDRRSLDPAVQSPLSAPAATVDAIAKALRAAGAGDKVYCISDILDADDRELRLADALKLVVGREQDSIVFPIGSRVAYYENHEGEQLILHRRA